MRSVVVRLARIPEARHLAESWPFSLSFGGWAVIDTALVRRWKRCGDRWMRWWSLVLVSSSCLPVPAPLCDRCRYGNLEKRVQVFHTAYFHISILIHIYFHIFVSSYLVKKSSYNLSFIKNAHTFVKFSYSFLKLNKFFLFKCMAHIFATLISHRTHILSWINYLVFFVWIIKSNLSLLWSWTVDTCKKACNLFFSNNSFASIMFYMSW